MLRKGFILLGSNIDPERNMKEAIRLLQKRFDLIAISSFYESEPIKKTNVANYLNAAVMFTTTLDPLQIKYRHCRKIEEQLGRSRSWDKFKPRTIDLDLVLLEDTVFTHEATSIILPDPGITKYAHIILPLAEIAPDMIHPVTGEKLGHIAKKFMNDPSIRIHTKLTDPKQII